jgi:nucleoid DNA-binding protein
LTSQDFAEELKKRNPDVQIAKSAWTRIYNSVFDTIQDELRKGNPVRIYNFGRFEMTKLKASTRKMTLPHMEGKEVQLPGKEFFSFVSLFLLYRPLLFSQKE